MDPLFTIGIPTINRVDLLNPTLEKYLVDFPSVEILILDNGHQDILEHDRIQFVQSGTNLGVARSWTQLCNIIFGSGGTRLKNAWNKQYAWILNDDIYSGKNESYMNGFIQTVMRNDQVDFVAGGTDWSNFIISRECFGEVGNFDPFFYPAYFEDNDYRYRMKLLKKSYLQAVELTPAIYRKSQSLAKNKSLGDRFEENQAYYKAKWGGLPDEETFRRPFNGKRAIDVNPKWNRPPGPIGH